jgi:pantoate--beta-alanine ligase
MPRTLYRQPPSAGAADGSMVVGASESIDYNAHCTWVNVDYLSQGLCAGSRPHFFRGVCTVVAKLFNIVEPDVACFGKKDYQQWRVLERMSRDLDFAIEIIGMPIQREDDGLAMSSRNALLTSEHRAAAPCINKALHVAKKDVSAGKVTSVDDLCAQISSAIESGGGRIDYVQLVDATTLKPLVGNVEVGGGGEREEPTILIAVAAHFGKVRLIDNVEF